VAHPEQQHVSRHALHGHDHVGPAKTEDNTRVIKTDRKEIKQTQHDGTNANANPRHQPTEMIEAASLRAWQQESKDPTNAHEVEAAGRLLHVCAHVRQEGLHQLK
jgi:hypothetical protein